MVTDVAVTRAVHTVTVLGGPTALIRLVGWTLLSDPTFDAAGTEYPGGGNAGFPVDFTIQTRPGGSTEWTTVRRSPGRPIPTQLHSPSATAHRVAW
ncbi:hypothetical protein [Streptomyces sp. RG80]|uniref:hypothetical protein n=1 Tax=Streptomyces sp. RG80 TaxID=3157340 RepID=UPI00338EFD80